MMFIITANFNYVYMLGDILGNWAKGPISDFQVIEKTSSGLENVCPEDYEYLFIFTWPGTKSGCDCRGITKGVKKSDYQGKITTGTCSIAQITDGCRIVPEVPGKQINSIGGKIYCIKRDLDFSYHSKYDTNIYEKNCPKSMKNCGVIDTLDYILCIDEDLECPIKNLFSSNEKSLLPYSYAANQIGEELESRIKKFSNYFVDLKLSQGLVCINNNEINLLTDHTYELLNKYKKIKCPTKIYLERNTSLHYDYRYFRLINFPTLSIFYKEDFLLNNIETLPDFPKEYMELPVSIFGRNYIGWKKKCRVYLPQLYEAHNFLSNLEMLSLMYLIYALLLLIYCMILIMILTELLNKKYFSKLTIVLIYLITVLVYLVLLLNDKSILTNLSNFTLTMIKTSCSDYETDMIFVRLHVLIIEVKKLFVLTIIFDLCILLIGLLKIFLIFYKIFKSNLLNRIQQGNVREFEMVLLI